MLEVFVIPVIVGILFRLIFIKKKKGRYATLAALSVALAFAGYAVYLYNFGHSGGNEGPGLLALAAGVSFLGTAVTEGLIWVYNKYK